MGEILWFRSFICHLKDRGFDVVHCCDLNMFLESYHACIFDNKPYYLIMDFLTIPHSINYLSENIEKIYCMCYWGRNERSIEQLGSLNGATIGLKNVLTPFLYDDKNSYLGYDMTYLCESFSRCVYEPIGLLWGKDNAYLDLNLIEQLTRRSAKFYSVCRDPIGIPGVTDLGILHKNSWCQLLHDTQYILSFGHPSSGPTILEALFYETVLICPRSQYPVSTHNENIIFTDELDVDAILIKIRGARFIKNAACDQLTNTGSYQHRLNSIFNFST